jgi:acyl carrier protein
MNANAKQKLRDFLTEAIQRHSGQSEFLDDDSLFISGLLDSFSMMNLVMYLEEAFGLDFSNLEFEVSLIDSVNAIATLVA